MRELVWTDQRTARWQEGQDLRLDGGADALVRPIAVACCDLDVWTVLGHAPLPGPFRIGHEGVAEVTEVGMDVRTVRPGDLVVVPFQVSCGKCAACRRGRTDSCDTVPLMTMYGMAPLAGRDAGGFLADAVRVPFADAMLLRLPTGVDPAMAASCSDNVVDGWRCVGPYSDELQALDPTDRRVLVVGYGSIGLYAAATGVALGAAVDYVDTDAVRLAMAAELGANAIEAAVPGRELGRYAITASTRPGANALRAAIQSTWASGVCTDAAVHFGGDIELPLLAMYTRGIRYVTGRAPARAGLPAVLDLLGSGRLVTAPVTAQTVPWDDADMVWPSMTGKTVFVRA